MFFVSLHSSKRKFAPAQYVNKERFLSPYLHSLFVIYSSTRAARTVFCSSLRRFSSPFGGSQRKLGMCKGEVSFAFSLSARVARTVFYSSFVRHLFVICSSFVRHLFVLSSSFVRLLFVIYSFFLRLLFVFCSSTRVDRTVFLLPVHSAMIASRATTVCVARTMILTVHLLICQ